MHDVCTGDQRKSRNNLRDQRCTEGTFESAVDVL